jgi:dTDP-4-dehydrorhamnose reductase
MTVASTEGADAAGASTPLELWAGAECTVNRVGDRYFDQLQRTGHDVRLRDIERLAALGARAVRFPVLWERCAPELSARGDFAWCDVRMERLATLGVRPVLGLVHHGSGPSYTSLRDPSFAPGLARFALQVAQRYPEVDAYTPINEPLTTARFSTLYGLWYPHERDLGALLAAVVNEVAAIRASMAEIRRINPGAKLYQTEDIGRVFSTEDLREQRDYENERRWLTLDLLFGRVGREHPLRRELERHGIDARLLDHWSDEPCAPDLIGINYYVTSDRFIDSRLERYPRHTWGGNGRQRYADVEAVRAHHEGIVGHERLIAEVWQRYRAPCALTEVHLACHREDQMRWLAEAWRGAEAARSGGADVRAVTLWSAFGAVGWNNLVSAPEGEYEPGAYDVRGPEPRATAIAALARCLARGEPIDGLACAAGWWRRDDRITCVPEAMLTSDRARPQVLVIGAGDFAMRVIERCARRFHCVDAPTLSAAHRLLRERGQSQGDSAPPWAMVLAHDPRLAAPDLLGELRLHWAGLCEYLAQQPRVLALSTSRVFAGWSERPYRESDAADAADPTGQSWRAFEHSVIELLPRSLLVRSGLLIDATLPDDPIAAMVDALRRGCAARVSAGALVSPTYLPHLLDASLDLLVDGESGHWHLAPARHCSPLDLVRRTAQLLEIPFLAPIEPAAESGSRGPMHALNSERGWPLPDIDATVAAYAHGLLEHSEPELATAVDRP